MYNCRFENIANPDAYGGALSIGGSLFLILNYVFAINCTGYVGGFVYCVSQRFNMTHCCGDMCVAKQLGQFGFFTPTGSLVNHYNMSSVQRSSPSREGSYYPVAFRTSHNIIHNFNSSFNILDLWGSGLNSLGAKSTIVQYSTFAQLFGRCVLLFQEINESASVLYCNVVNNYIYPSNEYEGVINFCLSMTINDCIFYNNTNNIFVCYEKPSNTINIYRSYIESSPGPQAIIFNPTLLPATSFAHKHVKNHNCDIYVDSTHLMKRINKFMRIALLHITCQ